MKILGIDIGGSGIKGGIVNTKSGKLVSQKIRFETPSPSSPKKVIKKIKKNIIKELDWNKYVGCGFPGIVNKNKILSAANVSNKWVGVDVSKRISRKTGCESFVLNDADAAGLAEMKYGSGKNKKGTVLMITVGTGLGTSIFIDGKLVPNIEFGHLKMYGDCAEKYASNSVRKQLDLSMNDWCSRFNEYIKYVEDLISPDLIIFGGGISKYFNEYNSLLKSRSKILPAKLENDAGIIGAALYTSLSLE
jgi:polyphosphate glucokinase|tara:strand:- start:657 stop:1400 length:744 start_codon:yes stop_codon:yes gene_type:complete